jgi:integrase
MLSIERPWIIRPVQAQQTSNIPPYIVPISVQALEIVRQMLSQVVPAQRYLFAHRSDLSKRISENTLNGALRRMGYADQLTGHWMRDTFLGDKVK